MGSAFLAPVILRPLLSNSVEKFVSLPFKQDNSKFVQFEKPLTCIIIGAGNRGWTYSCYAADHPEQMKILGIDEPVKIRQEKFKQAYNKKDSMKSHYIGFKAEENRHSGGNVMEL